MRRHEASALARWTALLEHTAPTSTAPAADDQPLGDGGSAGAEWSFHVAPQTLSDEEVEAVLALRRPHGWRQPVGEGEHLSGAAARSSWRLTAATIWPAPRHTARAR